MRVPKLRRAPLERLQRQITQLAEQARALDEQESRARSSVKTLRRRADGHGWRARRARRALPRAERRLESLSGQRRETIVSEFSDIMRALAEHSRRTREELDKALAPLVGLAVEWGQIERTFELLDETTGVPEIACFVGESRGNLSVPPFPVREEGSYVVPFPSDAFVF
jgi:chromosome segregation ATPase